MITERDLKEAIAECQGVREPNANTCIKLAAYYVILDHIQTPEKKIDEAEMPVYSYSAPPASTSRDNVTYYSESDFAKKIYGMDCEDVWPVMDELMNTLSILNPGLYNGVMRKLSEI